jgi:hypothetical protein
VVDDDSTATVVLLVLATNPIAFRPAVLRRDHTRVVMSRAKLLRLYRPD